MSDRIELRGLRVMTRCGALPEERDRAQPFELDIDVFADLSVAGASDALADTVDYGALTALVASTLEQEQYTLLERMAERVAELVLADERVIEVGVRATKLRPPVPQHLTSSGVSVRRLRPS